MPVQGWQKMGRRFEPEVRNQIPYEKEEKEKNCLYCRQNAVFSASVSTMKPPLSLITGTLAFYNLWGFPLSSEEIFTFFPSISPDDLKENFQFFEHAGSTYFSIDSDREKLKKRRQEGEEMSAKILKKAAKFTCILKHFPFLRGIALTNTPAMGMATKESDIDLFIIVKKGHIYTARFWSTLLFSLLGLRAKKRKTKDRFCLSFFVDEDYLDFSKIKNEHDIYLAFWLLTLKPLYNAEHFEKMKEANAKRIEAETGIKSVGSEEFGAGNKSSFLQRTFEILLFPFEKLFKCILLNKAHKFMNPSSPHYAPEMIFEDTIQKLHNPDMRRKIQNNWKKAIK